MKYKVVYGSSAGELEQVVNRLLGEGWKLYGNFSVKNGSCRGCYQALIYEEEK